MLKFLLIPDPAPGGGGTAVAEPPTDFVDSMVAEMNAAAGAPASGPASSPPEPAPPKPAAQPTPTPAKTEPTKPAAPATPAAKPPEKPDPNKPPVPASALDWNTAPAQFRTAFQKLKSEFDAKTTEYTQQLATTTRQMQELQAREFLTPEQKTRYTQLEERQQKLEAELYSRDYRESPEFQEKYQKKADRVFQTVQNELKGLQVTDAEGAEPRAATFADFQRVRALGESQVEQRRTAKAMFGEDADVVLGLARELKGIEDAANEEIETKRAGFQTERQKFQEQSRNDFQSSQQQFVTFDKTLAEKFNKFFGPLEGNDEFNKALQQGTEFVDANSRGFTTKTPAERAQTAAIIRRWATVWPANQILLKQKDAKIAELEATILKLQGSDPGAGGESGGATTNGGTNANGSGTDDLANEIAKLSQQV